MFLVTNVLNAAATDAGQAAAGWLLWALVAVVLLTVLFLIIVSFALRRVGQRSRAGRSGGHGHLAGEVDVWQESGRRLQVEDEQATSDDELPPPDEADDEEKPPNGSR